MKITGLSKLLDKKDVKLYEICELEVPLKDVVNYGMCNVEEVIFYYRENLPFDSLFSCEDIHYYIGKFRIKINGEIKEIKGVIFTSYLPKVVSFLCEHYVDGNKEIDNLIKNIGSKEKGIEIAVKKKTLNFIKYFPEEEYFSIEGKYPFINYKGNLIFTYSLDRENIFLIYREKFIKFKNYKIPRVEFLLFPYIPPERLDIPYIPSFMWRRGRKIKRILKRDNPFHYKRNLSVIHYDANRFRILRNLSPEIIKRFDKDGKINRKSDFEYLVGYNFLNFECFIPFKKEIKNKINHKTIKNPFNSKVIFAFDSRVPINFKKIKVIDDERIIYAFNYLLKKEKSLENFPLVYFHPSVKQNTEFLMIAGL